MKNGKQKTVKKRFFTVLALAFGVLLVGSGVMMLHETRDYREEEKAHEQVLQYRPSETEQENPTGGARRPQDGRTGRYDAEDGRIGKGVTETGNASVARLTADYPDAVGWISVPGTAVEYPFVQGKDNSYYLRKDMDGNYLYAGTPFLDAVCERELSNRNSIIYGHNLRNGSMFGDLEKLLDKDYFDAHESLVIYLPDRTVCAEIFAVLRIDATKKSFVYDSEPGSNYLEQIKSAAARLRDVPDDESMRFITLSTCGYEFENERIILIASYKPVN